EADAAVEAGAELVGGGRKKVDWFRVGQHKRAVMEGLGIRARGEAVGPIGGVAAAAGNSRARTAHLIGNAAGDDGILGAELDRVVRAAADERAGRTAGEQVGIAAADEGASPRVGVVGAGANKSGDTPWLE